MAGYKRIYAVDFDGTIAETKFPEIIRPITPMVETCRKIKKNGDILILWTCRCGKDLEAAVEYCKQLGIEFDYINENVPENVEKWGNDSRKIFAHEYIDDKAWSPERELYYVRQITQLRLKYLKNAGKITLLAYAVAMILFVVTVYTLKHFGIV